MSCDEVMMMDNQSWVNIHVYFANGFKCISILLNLEKLISSGTIDNLTTMILIFLLVYGGLTVEKINNKLICFGFDGVVVFIRVLKEYKLLVVKMNDDFHFVPTVKLTLEFLCDVEVIMPMLEVVHEFIKFVQNHDTFVYNFVGVMKIYCVDLYSLYCDSN